MSRYFRVSNEIHQVFLNLLSKFHESKNCETRSRCIIYCILIFQVYFSQCRQVNSRKTMKKENLPFFVFPLILCQRFLIERARGKKPTQEYIRWMEKDDGVDFVWIFRRQCGDEADPCSEAENFSVEETTLTTSTTTTAGTTTSTRKVTGSRLNEIIPPPFLYIALTYSTFSRSRKDMARLQTGINFLPCIRLFLLFYFPKLKRRK